MFLIITICGLLICMAESANASDIKINGEVYQMQSRIVNGTTIVSLWDLSKALNFTAEWDSDTQIISIVNKDTSKLINKSLLIDNSGKQREISLAAQMQGNTIMVPLRLLCESLGYKVDWNEKSHNILISTNNLSQKYLLLLKKTLEDYKSDPLDIDLNLIQPMTVGLILSSEVKHYENNPNSNSEVIIRSQVKWLLEHADDDKDGIYGWGLPQEWDAFNDGSTNPANTPYTITTALVGYGLLDALSLNNFWNSSDYNQIINLLDLIALYWCNNAWTDYKSGGGYFWYSLKKSDDYFTPNVSSMFLGFLSQLLSEHNTYLSQPQRAFIKNRIDKAATAIISMAELRDGEPYWNYIYFEDESKNTPNDLVHHIYILQGMEYYRLRGGQVNIPWSTKDSIKSVNSFSQEGEIYRFSNKEYERIKNMPDYCTPSNLWGTGMMLAFYSQNNELDRAKDVFEIISQNYGPFANLKLWPENFSKESIFYGRHAAHVLYGMANMMFLNYNNTDIIRNFSNGILSDELFTLPTGLNEFDICYVDGIYHLFYDDKIQTKHREAKTIAELANATDDFSISGRYPSILYENNIWHLWICDQEKPFTNHYVANDAKGPYKYSDTCPKNLADIDVTRNSMNNKYYAGYKHLESLRGGVLVSDSPYGPWVDLGNVFDKYTANSWHEYEEADGSVFFNMGRAYFLFAGWDGIKQKLGIVEFNPMTGKAISPATCLLSPELPWQQRNNSLKIFNPVYINAQDSSIQNARIYYAHNPSAAVNAGWGYIEAKQSCKSIEEVINKNKTDF
jgi:hypothetical protein